MADLEVEEGAGGEERGRGPEGMTTSRHTVGAGRPLSLNSNKLTGALLKQLATGLEIPTGASGDELRQLIDRKLVDMGHDPRGPV